MEYLCDFIVDNIDVSVTETLYAQTFTNDEFYELDSCIDIIKYNLKLDDSDIVVNKENINKQRAVVISLKYKNRKCEFYEHFDTQRDYICIRMLSV
jgi:hypothetical protein